MSKIRPYKHDITGKLWTLDYRDYLGKRHQLRFRGTEKQASMVLNRLLDKSDRIRYGIEYAIHDMPLSEAFSKFLEHLVVQVSKVITLNRYEVAYNSLRPVFGVSNPLSSFTIRTVQEYQKKRLGSVTPPTFSSDIRHLKAFFQWLEDFEYILRSPFRKFRYSPPNNEHLKANKVMKIPEVLTLLNTALDLNLEGYQIILFLLSTGMRVGEIDRANLHWDNISFDRGKYSYLLKNRRRPYMVTKDLHGITKEILSLRKVYSPDFPFDYNSEYISKHILKPIFEAAKLKYTTHDLRRTAGGHIYLETGDIYKAMEFLNHSSVDTTTNHYVRLKSRDDYISDVSLSQVMETCLQHINILETKLDHSSAFELDSLKKALEGLAQ